MIFLFMGMQHEILVLITLASSERSGEPAQKNRLTLWISDRVLDLILNGRRWRLTRGNALCPCARHFILCLVLVQPRKTGNHPKMAEKLLTGM